MRALDKLPPENVIKERDHLKQIVSRFFLTPLDVDAILKFLKDTCDDLISIKEKLGKEHSFYRQQCTFIAQLALDKSVETLNRVQEIEFPKLEGLDRVAAINTIKHGLAVSWKTMLWIELIETDTEFKDNRLTPNRKALLKILISVDAFNYPSRSTTTGRPHSVFEGCARNITVDPYTYYTEKELFSAGLTLDICNKYIEKFPEGEHIAEVRERILQINDNKKYNSAKTIDDYKDYLAVYPNGIHVDEAKQRIEFLLEEQRKKREEEINDLLARIDKSSNARDCSGLFEVCKKYGSVPLMAKLDDRCFSLCLDSDDYKLYVTSFGENAIHISEAREIIRKTRRRNFLLVFVLALTIISTIGLSLLYKIKENERAFNERQELIYRQYENLRLTSDVDSYIVFLKNFPECNDSIRKSVQAVLPGLLILKADSLIKNYNDDTSSLQDFLDEYREVAGINTDEAVNMVSEELADAKERHRKQAEYEKYGTDSNAWRTATSINTIDAYNDYLRRYPHGIHKNEANKKIIDLEVQSVKNSGDYFSLPSSQKVSYKTGIKSTVKIKNSCNRTITIMYSGKESLKVQIAPNKTHNIVLPSGFYSVVAKAPGARYYYGLENLTGGVYEVEYYIETKKY